MFGKPKAKTPAAPLMDWERVERIFTNASAFSLKSVLRTGVSERLNQHRVSRLVEGKRAKALDAIVRDMSKRDLRRLKVMGRVNLDQAAAAFRVTVFSNVTLFVAAFAISNQIMPGWIADIWMAADAVDRIIHVSAILFAVMVGAGLSIYGYGGVSAARDLNHLLDLHLVDMDDGDLATVEDYASNTVSDLRSMQLSDV